MEGKQKHGEFSVILRLVGDWWIGPWGTLGGLDGDAFPGSWNVWKVHEVRRSKGKDGESLQQVTNHYGVTMP